MPVLSPTRQLPKCNWRIACHSFATGERPDSTARSLRHGGLGAGGILGWFGMSFGTGATHYKRAPRSCKLRLLC